MHIPCVGIKLNVAILVDNHAIEYRADVFVRTLIKERPFVILQRKWENQDQSRSPFTVPAEQLVFTKCLSAVSLSIRRVVCREVRRTTAGSHVPKHGPGVTADYAAVLT